jgi:hypothetical protein
MGIFSGAASVATDTGAQREERPYLSDGQRVLEIERALLRKGTNENNSRTYKQWMLVVEFRVVETLSGESQNTGKVIEVLQRDIDGDLTKSGQYAMSRVKGLAAAALQVAPEEVNESHLEQVFDPDSDGTALSGVRVMATTNSFTTKAGGVFSPTTYTPVG